MKNFVLLVVLLLATSTYAQNISPYFPTPFATSSTNKYQTQITYFDFNFVSIRLQRYMESRFLMGLNDDKVKYALNEGRGEVTLAFIDNVSMNRNPREMFFTCTVFPIGDELVIKSMKITGTPDAVLRFYVGYWTTTLNFEEVSKTEIVSNRLLQDRISYSFNDGDTYIRVENTTIDDTEAFIKEYQAKKAEYDKNAEAREAQAKKEAEARAEEARAEEARAQARRKEAEAQRDKERNTKTTTVDYHVVKKKRSIKFEKTTRFPDRHAENAALERRFEEFLAEQKRGTYTIEVEYLTVYDEIKDVKLTIKDYTKSNGIMNAVKGGSKILRVIP